MIDNKTKPEDYAKQEEVLRFLGYIKQMEIIDAIGVMRMLNIELVETDESQPADENQQPSITAKEGNIILSELIDTFVTTAPNRRKNLLKIMKEAVGKPNKATKKKYKKKKKKK